MLSSIVDCKEAAFALGMVGSSELLQLDRAINTRLMKIAMNTLRLFITKDFGFMLMNVL